LTLFICLFIYLYFFSSTHLTGHSPQPILRAMAQKTRFHARKCLLGVKKVEINIEPLFMTPKVKFWQKSGLGTFLAENALQWRCSGVNDP